jgi:hypothetical protein
MFLAHWSLFGQSYALQPREYLPGKDSLFSASFWVSSISIIIRLHLTFCRLRRKCRSNQLHSNRQHFLYPRGTGPSALLVVFGNRSFHHHRGRSQLRFWANNIRHFKEMAVHLYFLRCTNFYFRSLVLGYTKFPCVSLVLNS